MKNSTAINKFASAFLALAMFVVPISIGAQTKISAPKNKYKISDDAKLGREAAQEAERRYPILNDSQVTNYVARVGEKLAAAIPSEFAHSEFDYQFKVINAKDINAFALPGGYMYVNRGMIEAAKNEGEMAGVMAHEISHVALRHGTAGATKQNSIGSQILGIGAVLGGAILAGEAGAQAGAIVGQAYFTKFSREYETQADVLGAQILARAGYDPNDLANMFKTIEAQGGSSGVPEFLSSHPKPARRYERISQESALLRVENPIRNTRDFTNAQSRLRGMPGARTTAEIEKSGGQGGGTTSPTANGRYSRSVPAPSTRTKTYTASNTLSVNIPDNWQEFANGSDITFAPEGAYGADGITHGAMIGVVQSNNQNLRTATQTYINDLLQGNTYLRQSGGYSNANLDGRSALAAKLTGTSPITGQGEVVTVYTTQMSDGTLLYLATVAPNNAASSYSRAFQSLINSLQIND